MAKKLEVGVIGLGKFGSSLARTLTELGHNIIGLDSDEHKVRSAQDWLAKVYMGDATDKTLLQQLRFQDLDCAAVSVGKSMEISILATLNLQELNLPQIVVKSISPEHSKILRRLGLEWVVEPEADMAKQVALRLVNPGMLDLLPLGGGILVQEVVVERWQGQTLAQLALPQQGVMVVAKMPLGQGQNFQFVPNAHQPLQQGDRLIVIGSKDKVLKLLP